MRGSSTLSGFAGFTVRNLKVFFKDKAAVFFSLLGVFIIIGLYALFLGDVWQESLSDIPGARTLMDSWIMAGMLAVTSVTTTMGAFGNIVSDRALKIEKDFAVSPAGRPALVGGYIASSVIIGVVMGLVALVFAQIYMVSNGGAWMSPLTLVQTVGLIVLSTIANSALVLFIVSFFRSVNAFATASTILGTLIGFLTGIYLPVGTLPDAVQMVVKLFPVSHAAVLFRRVMMAEPMAVSFRNAPPQALEDFETLMGVSFRFGGWVMPAVFSAGIVVATAVLFYTLALLNLSRKKR